MRRFLWIIATIITCLAAHADVYDNMRLIDKTLYCLENFYVDTVDTDKLSEVAIRAMLKELDPHTDYLTPEQVKQMNENLGAGFEGIGIIYRMDADTLFVIGVTPDGPSAKAGILPGDQILSVGDSILCSRGLSTQQIQKLLRGPKGTKALLKVKRQGIRRPLKFDVVRDRVPINSIECAYMLTPTVGYIYISRFASTTPAEMNRAIRQLTEQGMKDLIIDLQDNGGGYLQSAVSLAEFFLPSDELVVYTDGRNNPRREYRTSDFLTAPETFEGRIVVIINEQSASASEIFAGCIQDLDRGVVIGRRSFGKGLVQQPVELGNGAMIRLTVSHYFTPSGRCIQKPYDKGNKKEYERDILRRFEHGELQNADSTHFSNELKHQTRHGRNVYGGGGIMPDVFVPLDTTRLSPLHRALQRSGTLTKYVANYYRLNVVDMCATYQAPEVFLEQFEVSDKMIEDLLNMAKNDSVSLVINTDPQQLDSILVVMKQNNLLRLHLKAQIANDLFRAGIYTRLMNTESVYCKTALDILNDTKKYHSILTEK